MESDFSVSPHYVPFSSTFLFGNRSQRLAGPHTQDIRMTRMVRLDQAQNLNKGPGAYKPSVDHTIAATRKIWPLVLTEADGAPSRRAVITCARQGLHFGQTKLKTRKVLTCQKEAHSCHHSSCSCTRSLIRLTRTASIYLICRKHGGQSTVVT